MSRPRVLEHISSVNLIGQSVVSAPEQKELTVTSILVIGDNKCAFRESTLNKNNIILNFDDMF